MSRTRRKNLRVFFCTGSNTDFYRRRNRFLRRHHLRHIFANYKSELLDEKLNFKVLPKEDQLDEPIDGHYVLIRKQIQAKLEMAQYKYRKGDPQAKWDIEFWEKKLKDLR